MTPTRRRPGGAPRLTARPSTGLPELTDEERIRYGRHLALPDVGLEGQRRLKAARALIVGTGGLGAPAALYLAAAGVGTIGLVDFDRVEASNLQRQVLFATADIGRSKLDASTERLRALNPNVTLVRHEGELDAGNILDVLASYDILLDGTDNFPSRYLINDACVRLGRPDVFGSVYRFEGQVSVFAPPAGPCYRCLFPEPPPAEAVPSCAEGGVLGLLPGVVGTIQATEALKVLLGIGSPLVGRLLLYDALEMRFRELEIRRDPDCSRCSPRHRSDPLTEVVLAPAVGDPAQDLEIGAEELDRALRGPAPPLLVDVREPGEFAEGHLDGARLIPLGELAGHADELRGAVPVVLYCQMGGRSGRGARLLRDAGLTTARSLKGGLRAYRARLPRAGGNDVRTPRGAARGRSSR